MNRREVLNSIQTGLSTNGFDAALILRNYDFADFTENESKVLQVPLAAFAGYPCTYRNACAAAAFSDRSRDRQAFVFGHRSLGAPLFFEVVNETVQPWAVGHDSAVLIGDAFPLDSISDKFRENRTSWNPQALGRIKAPGEARPNRQLDFFDAGLLSVLSEFFQTKLKDLLERAFVSTAACYEELHGEPPAIACLFPYLFRFVTAKIFMDRADAKGWENLLSPRNVLEKAEEHSGSGLLEKLPSSFLHETLLAEAWRSVSTTLHFQNLSVPDLAYIYESSFINENTRRELGIHSTPLGLAEYIVQHLPWDSIAVEDRNVFEPFCGHGIFLASAMDRLREDLPDNQTPRQRHTYFRRMLTGVEKDPLAIEVCRLVLTLSDYPNSNNWQLHQDDVFTWPNWDKTLRSSSVLLANPPYESFTPEQRRAAGASKSTPPAEMLRRLMQHPPAMLGLVLPQSFLSSPFYQDANKAIARSYENITIVELPPIFRYADNETIALLASGKREVGNTVAVRYSEVLPSKRERFFEDFHVSHQRSKKLSLSAENKPFTLWIPAEDSIWDRLGQFDSLETIADIHKGIEWIARKDGEPKTAPRTDVASDNAKDGYCPGVEKMRQNLSQFHIRRFRYLSLLEKDHRPQSKAWEYAWNKRKVVFNAARFERKSPWRIAAWADPEGLVFTKEFFAIWPREEISVFALAAILCSPICNAFSFTHDLERHNHISTLRRLPIPSVERLREAGELHNRGEQLQSMLEDEACSSATVIEELLRLDAAVLDAYELSDRVQRQLLDQFQDWSRPVAVNFTGYFPEHFRDVISLSDLVTIRYDWEKTNDRRCDLIDKDLSRVGLTKDERAELDRLQYLADILVRLEAPYPNEELDQMIADLKAQGKWIDST